MTHSLHTRQEFLIDLIQNGSTMYGYSLRDRKGIFSPILARRFGAPDTVEDMPDWMIMQGNVAPDSIDKWCGLFAAIDRGENSGAVMVTLKSDDGGFGRYWLHADVISDENGRPFFALISSDDFTELSRQFRAKDDDIRVLLYATESTFPEILSINLTKGLYRVIRCDTGSIVDLPETGKLHDMIRIRTGSVCPDDRTGYSAAFSPERLATAFLQNREESVQMAYRCPGPDGTLYWMETTMRRQEDPQSGDVMLISMSRNVDAQKAEEIRLREQVRQQEEELRLTMVQFGKVVFYYDIAARTMTVPPNIAERSKLPVVMENFPDAFLGIVADCFSPESVETYQNIFREIQSGSPSGSHDFPMTDKTGREQWIRQEYTTIFDDQKCPVRTVLALSDVTEEYVQALETRRLKENEYLLQMTAQHSERVVCHYDVKNQSARVLDLQACAGCQLPRLCEMNKQAVLESGRFSPESVELLRGMFWSIEEGIGVGALKIQAIAENGELCWFDLKYSTIYNEQDEPVSAILSHKDITEEYERELAYQRYVQSIESNAEGNLMYIESDLTADRIERLAGQMLSAEDRTVNCSHSDFGRLMLELKFQFEDADGSSKYFSCENLLDQYVRGERHLKNEWRVRFGNDVLYWMSIETTLIADPFNGHVRAFFRMVDITEEMEERLEIQHRSERDSMTGLYNRATAEAKVRSLMAEKDPGILVLIDLDDLKGINDTFGHKEGDRAILGITETMQAYFRESDVLGRLGGDEFLVYLPSMAENIDNISVTLTSMLRKLSGIAIGANGERRIHCSVGCAVQSPDAETFDTLFKQADTALYHVKRSGKNNFAFYEPEMEQEDYQFRTKQLHSLQSVKKFDTVELHHLLNSIASFNQLVVSANLSGNNYYLMENSEDAEKFQSPIPDFGSLDQLMEIFTDAVHPDDRVEFSAILSRQALLETYAQGAKNVQHHYRYKYQDVYRWAESIVVFYTSEQGDVCNFTMMRWADERAHELERLWLQKVMELAVNVSFEYICLVNLNSGEYSLFGNEENTHSVPPSGDFDAVTRSIRDLSIEESKRAEYYENARIATIAARMRENDGNYSYIYAMSDGDRRASFHWFEPTHTQVLMTVQRVVKSC